MEDIHRALLGNLSLKSSVLSTKGENITKQFMVASNMLSHYKKLQNVKSAIDTKPPKAMLYSTKAREQRLRRLTRTDDKAVLAIKALLAVKNPNLGYLSPSVDTQKLDGRSGIRSKPAEAEPSDILELHSHKFTPGKPFRPRTNLSDRPSKLSQMRVYNPPPMRARSATRASSRQPSNPNTCRTPEGGPRTDPSTPHSLEGHSFSSSSSYSSSARRQRSQQHQQQQLQKQRLSLTKNTLDDMTLRSPPPTASSYSRNLDIPLLDISVDRDNQLWQKALSDQRNGLNSTETLEKKNAGDRAREGGNASNSSNLLGTSTLKTADLKSLEEDCKYIEFLQEVTEDILQKGTYTNKLLTKIFEYHIDKHVHQLKESRMREMLNQLRIDLGVAYDERDGDGDDGNRFLDHVISSPLAANGSRSKKRTKTEPREMAKFEGSRGKKDFASSYDNGNQNNNNNNNSGINSGNGNGQALIGSATDRSGATQSTARTGAAGKSSKGKLEPTSLLPPADGENIENVRRWLNENSENGSYRMSASEPEEEAKAEERREEPETGGRDENSGASKAASKIKAKTETSEKYDDDYDDDTIASVSSLEEHFVDDQYDEDDAEDLLDYYNDTVSSEDVEARGRVEMNLFNRTSLSDIPEMSYRSEMVKQRSGEEGAAEEGEEKEKEISSTERKDEMSRDSPNKQLISSRHEGDSSSRLSSSRSRRRARVVRLGSTGRSNAIDSCNQKEEDSSLGVTLKAKDTGDRSNDAITPCDRDLEKTPDGSFASAGDENRSAGDGGRRSSVAESLNRKEKEAEKDSRGDDEDEDEDDDATIAGDKDGDGSGDDDDDDYDDDIEEECSIPVGESSEDDEGGSGRGGGGGPEKKKELLF